MMFCKVFLLQLAFFARIEAGFRDSLWKIAGEAILFPVEAFRPVQAGKQHTLADPN